MFGLRARYNRAQYATNLRFATNHGIPQKGDFKENEN